jgi:cell division septal protein FtsQ
MYTERGGTAGALPGRGGSNHGSHGRTGRRGKATTARHGKVLLYLGLLLFAAMFGWFIFHLFIRSAVMIETVDVIVDGESTGSDYSVVSAAGINFNEGFFKFDCNAAESTIQSLSYVEDVRVTKKFPSTVKISIERRDPVALMLGADGKMVFYDAEGFALKQSDLGCNSDYPVLSGAFSQLLNSDIIASKVAVDVLSQLKQLKSENSSLFRLISEIKFDKKGMKDFELVVFLKGYNVPLRLSSVLDCDLLLVSVGVLDALKSLEREDIKEVDFRAQKPVYICGG